MAHAFGAADRDRGRDQVGVFERVVGDAEGRQPAEGLDAQFDQVGGVFVVSVTARVVIGSVWGREEVAPAGVAPGRVHRVAGVGDLLGSVVVVDVSLIEELALAVRARTRDQDRLGIPARAGRVRELRRYGERFVQDRRAGRRRGALFFG